MSLESLKQRCIDDLVSIVGAWPRALSRHDLPIDQAPPDGSWSPCELALHVVLSLETVADGFARGLASGFEVSPGPTLEQSWLRVTVLTTFRIPPRWTSPEDWRPGLILPPHELEARFERARAAYLPLLSLVGRERREAWLGHPRLGPLRFDEFLRFLYVHSLHHLRLLRQAGAAGS